LFLFAKLGLKSWLNAHLVTTVTVKFALAQPAALLPLHIKGLKVERLEF
jgi:hypothetical protein